MKKIRIKNLSILLLFYMVALLSSISCFSDKMEILFHEAAPQLNYYICESKMCPDDKSTTIGETVILDLSGLDPNATDIKWSVTGAPGRGGVIWYPPQQNAKIQSFTPGSVGVYSINVSYSANGARCICNFIIDVSPTDCSNNICPKSTSMVLGDSITLDIEGVDPGASQIYWRIISSPGSATWAPPEGNAISEKFTPNKVGTYKLQVSYVVDGYTCSCDFIVNVVPSCDQSICPGSQTISFGESITLDIQGVDPAATNINWTVLSSPGGATWDPPEKNAISEKFTPDQAGTYELEVSYVIGGQICSCKFNVKVVASCNTNICPEDKTMTLGNTTTLDIKGVDSKATDINWQILSSPGGATWDPPGKNAITEKFTPKSNGTYKLQVSYMVGGVTCSCNFKIVVEKEPVIVPLTIDWKTTQKGLIKNGGWKISNQGRTIRFVVEDSLNCGGDNSKVQSGTATATITVGEEYTFIPKIVGVAELQNSGLENITVKLDGKVMVLATSKQEYKKCSMGPVDMTEISPPPYVLKPGNHTFILEFTTFDGLYHVGCYYEVNLLFKK